MAYVNESQALELLQNGEIVALPTETVYGLAGRVDSDPALKKIFAAKRRPFYDPLIVHVLNLEQGQAYAEVDPVSAVLAKNFWPGPLTLVLPKTDRVSPLINNGGSSVALRSPNHPLFLNLLSELNVPLAAPSANMFGKTSPTESSHVEDEFSGSVPILDGGLCFKGIESTVIQVFPENNKIHILRPGIIHAQEIQDFLDQHHLDLKVEARFSEAAPGHLKNHYQPSVPVVLVDSKMELDSEGMKKLQSISNEPWTILDVEDTPPLAARHLYAQFRRFSKEEKSLLIVVKKQWKQSSEWAGFYDRICKAASATLTDASGVWDLQIKS